MAATEIHSPADRTLLAFLAAQRTSVMAIVAGLSDAELRTPAVPSGWTPLGLIEHLGYAERHWFQRVATGSVTDLPWPPDPDEPGEGADAAFATSRPAQTVFGFYEDQCERATGLLESTPLSSAPRGRVNPDLAAEITDLRGIVLHMIEETARHAGHLDIARELIDGATGLGPR